MGSALQNLGRHDEAVAEHQRALDLAEGTAFMRPVLARSLALAGRVGEARALLAPEGPADASPYQAATVHLALGETSRALELLAVGGGRAGPLDRAPRRRPDDAGAAGPAGVRGAGHESARGLTDGSGTGLPGAFEIPRVLRSTGSTLGG